MSEGYTKGALIYEGKASRVYEVKNIRGCLILERKDDVTAGNGEKKGTIPNKGIYNNQISNCLFRALDKEGIPNHYLRELSERETLVTRTEPIPLEVIVRNLAAGSILKRSPFKEGEEFNEPIFAIHYKNDRLDDPLINRDEAKALGALRDFDSDYEEIREMALCINEVLRDIFDSIGIILVDFKLEFGYDGSVITLIDEISPDTMRLWDKETRKKLDKDRFRQDLGDEAGAYKEVHRRLSEQKLFQEGDAKA